MIDQVKALAFGAVIVAWALVKLVPAAADGSSTVATTPPTVYAATEVGQASTNNDPAPLPASGAPAEPDPPRATGTPVQPATARPPAAATPDAVARELELQARLESDARAYTRALIAGDVAGVRNLLADRCGGVDVPALIVRRRANLSLDLGVSLSETTASAPLVGHFDAGEGVAHAFLGFEFGGRQLLPRTIDGWLYESGRWRNAECTG